MKRQAESALSLGECLRIEIELRLYAKGVERVSRASSSRVRLSGR